MKSAKILSLSLISWGMSASAAEMPVIILEKDVLIQNLVADGVPEDALVRLLKFREENLWREFTQKTYTCKGKEETSIKPCVESDRSSSTQTVTVPDHPYAVIIDYSKPSTEERFFLINLREGKVQKKFRVSHGIGSGDGNVPYRFSNTKDSRQTSLGIHLVGGVYNGSYGATLRMYGLEPSNDRAYDRDIVMHGAWYADSSFIDKINSKTKKPYGRLGVSWGCPAVAPGNQRYLLPLLKDGALVMHYHPELQDRARVGWEVKTFFPPDEYIPRPTPRPDVTPQPEESSLASEE